MKDCDEQVPYVENGMKYYRPDPWDGIAIISAFSTTGSGDEFITDDLVPMTKGEVLGYFERINTPSPEQIETSWRDKEYAGIEEILLMIEDDDPAAPTGTERQWRDYRIALRAWKDGADGWPDSANRPKRPA